LEHRYTIVQQETQTVTQPVSNIEKPVKEEVPASKNEKIITAPIVGTFYCAPTPDAKPYVNVGDCVKKGDTLCILEAMKMMNELEAEEDCTILEILAPQGELIEYGQPIFKVSL
jgi:acetyl-CoA carboxylase biotin carboxyl carrier protein